MDGDDADDDGLYSNSLHPCSGTGSLFPFEQPPPLFRKQFVEQDFSAQKTNRQTIDLERRLGPNILGSGSPCGCFLLVIWFVS